MVGGWLVGKIRIKAIPVKSIEIEFGMTGTELGKMNLNLEWNKNAQKCRKNAQNEKK